MTSGTLGLGDRRLGRWDTGEVSIAGVLDAVEGSGPGLPQPGQEHALTLYIGQIY